MNYSDGGYSLADIAAATGRNGNNDGFGEGSWVWVLVFLIFALGGWGNRGGFGGSGGGTGSVSDNYVLASDFATLQRQIDSATNTLERKADATQQGLCDGFYAMNTGMLNGFSGVQQTLCQGFSGVNSTINTTGYETRNAINGIGSQLASCCCSLEKGQMETNYLNAQNTCAITNTVQNTSRDTIDAINGIYRSLHDEIVANRIEDKNAQITAQQNEINALRLAASQERQNSFLISQLNPTPVPSFPVANPNCCLNYQVTSGCGCGCN